MTSNKKIVTYTLGCRANQYQGAILTEAVEDQIVEAQNVATQDAEPLRFTKFGQPADIYIINTCTVTSDSDKKSRQAIRRAIKLAKKVIVSGCFARLNKESLQKEFPTVEFIDPDFKPTTKRDANRIRSFLMIEDGCENFCSYCIVPYARGKIKTKPVQDVLNEARELVETGAREIILTGINLGEYGEKHLISIIDKLSEIKNLLRIRLSSIEPMYVTNALLKTISSNPKACHQLHIPLQSGDDQILKAMNRKYKVKNFSDLIEKIYKIIPNCGVSTDVITGFPGETDQNFKNTYNFCKEFSFSRIHIFPYSRREGTKAAKMQDQLPIKTIKERVGQLNKLRAELMKKFAGNYFGKEVEVLVEQKGKGLTSNFIRTKFNGTKDIVGQLYRFILREENLILD